MKTLLRIDCSARHEGSHSRALTDYFEEKWRNKNPGGKVVHRDLATQQLPHIQNNTIIGFYTPPEFASAEIKEALSISDTLIEELRIADEIVVSSPLYNLNVPSNLKAYLDQVVRIGYTFGIDEKGYYGMLKHKTAFFVTTKGGAYRDTPMEALDFQEPYLQAIFKHMGIDTGGLFSLEGTSDRGVATQNMKEMQNQINEFFKTTNK